MKKQNTDKNTNWTVLRLCMISFFVILSCVVLLSSTTWAWFSGTVSSSSNEIKTASTCLLAVSVVDDESLSVGSVSANDSDPTPDDGVPVNMTLTLKPDVTYSVTLTLPKNSGSGFCLVDAGENTYYTDTLYAHTNDTESKLSFTLTVSEETEVIFTPRWGIYSGDVSVQNGETLAVN